jgi:phage terminase large subunit-like protein
MPRGNGKSALAAVLALYGLLADDEPGAQVITVASDERQARLVYNAARRMIELDERLRERVQVFQDRLYVPHTDSAMMPLPAEPGALQGFDPSLVIVDELHVVTEPVWDAMALAAGKRAESLTLAISTPADRTDSIMWRLVEYGRKHPEDKSFRLVEYAAPEGCDLDDRAAWRAANPALGDFLHEDAIEATLKTTREPAFRRYRLGQWTGRADTWLPWGLWETRADVSRGTPADGERIVLAFDGSASGDSTALMGCTLDGYLFPVAIWQAPEGDERWRVPRHEVSSIVASAFDRWDVIELAADPWGWRSELEEWAKAHGSRVVEWNTAYARRMAPATDRFYAAVVDERLTHDGDAVLAEHVGNCVAKSTALGDLVAKDRRGSSRKIDAAVAAIVAYDRAAWHLANPPKRRRVAAL